MMRLLNTFGRRPRRFQLSFLAPESEQNANALITADLVENRKHCLISCVRCWAIRENQAVKSARVGQHSQPQLTLAGDLTTLRFFFAFFGEFERNRDVTPVMMSNVCKVGS